MSSGKIWATDVRFTKDKTEFIHARDVADEYINTVKTDGERFPFPTEELSKCSIRPSMKEFCQPMKAMQHITP
jgi:hypothetical protein